MGCDFLKVMEAEAMASDLEQGTDNGTYHIAEKPVGGDLKIPFVGRCLYPLRPREVADCRLAVIVGLAERLEIGQAKQCGSRFIHQRKVERVVSLYGEVAQERVLTGVDEITVSTLRGREAGVKILRHRLQLPTGDVLREQLIEPIEHLLTVEARHIVEMADHRAGMNPRVGTSGPGNLHFVPQNFGECLLQTLLHGHAVGLNLPAVVGRAVEAQREEVALRGSGGEADVSAVVERDVAFHQAFCSLKSMNVKRIGGQLLLQLPLTLL